MIPPFEQCPKRHKSLTPTGEHIVQANEMAFDGYTYMGWCKFCGMAIEADSEVDYWHPLQFFVIREELELADLLPQ